MTTPYRSKIGWFDYNDSGTPQQHSGSGGFIKLTNDTLGQFTKRGFAPIGVSDVWNPVTNQFDFTELAVGDMIDIRFDMEMTTTSNNQEIYLQMAIGIGSSSPHELPFGQSIIKSATSGRFVRPINIYIGSDQTRDYPSEIQVDSDGTLPMIIRGWYVKITRR